MKRVQQSADSLDRVRLLVRNKEVKQRQYGGTSRCLTQSGLIFKEFQSPTVANGRTLKQLIAHAKYKYTVRRTAHDSIMSGHLDTKNILDRVTSEFYWPVITTIVTNYCRSCDVCQRTLPKGKVLKAPLGSMPLIEIPCQQSTSICK